MLIHFWPYTLQNSNSMFGTLKDSYLVSGIKNILEHGCLLFCH